MRRREFITLLGGAAVSWPLAARAQQPDERVRRVAILVGSSADDLSMQRGVATFTKAMHALGWVDGANIQFVFRAGSGRLDLIQTFARELVGSNPDLILASSTPVLAAVRQETNTIPIVFSQVTDPVAQGFVKSIALPGGNITGLSHWEAPMGGKWLALLKEAAPRIVHVGVIFNPETAPYFGMFLRSMDASAHSVKLTARPVKSPAEIESAMTATSSEPDGGLVVMSDSFTNLHSKQIIALAARYHLPAIYAFAFFVADGGLMSYGINVPDIWRRSAAYVDRILKGAKPAELPIQLPTKFELAINLKTAKALGVTVPITLLVAADEVIE